MRYKVLIENDAQGDIQKALDWYYNKLPGLDKKFYEELSRGIDALRINPWFQIRYDDVRCYPIRKFPFMIHFSIRPQQRTVVIRAVFHTSISPDNWGKRGI